MSSDNYEWKERIQTFLRVRVVANACVSPNYISSERDPEHGPALPDCPGNESLRLRDRVCVRRYQGISDGGQ
jgi:hypothetical protein